MTKKLPPMVRRAIITNKTVAKFQGQDHLWGKRDCLHLVRSQIVQFGHNCPQMPAYNSAAGAVRALKKRGFDDLGELMDSIGLIRITPAARLLGDIVMMKGEEGDPLDALTVDVGRNVLGWYSNPPEKAVVLIPHEIKAVWSVLT